MSHCPHLRAELRIQTLPQSIGPAYKMMPLKHQQVLTHPAKIRVTNPPNTSVYNNLLTYTKSPMLQ